LELHAGQTLTVFFGLNGQGTAASLRKRTYSAWSYDLVTSRLKLAVCTFSEGPGAEWDQQCQPGDTVHFYGPGGKFMLDPTAFAYALLGDVSCLAHFYELRRKLPPHIPMASVVHACHADDCFPDLNGNWPLHVVVADTLSASQYLAAAESQGLQRAAPQALIY
jgi:NADPH-dependent ferric siderophore reductase